MSGRHAPTFKHSDSPETLEAVNALIKDTGLNQIMKQAIELGQVGAACITFKFLKNFEEELTLVTDVYRAQDCWPIFDATKELVRLRIAYIVYGSHFIQNGLNFDYEGAEINPNRHYWFVKDLTRNEEIHYFPVASNLYNPGKGEDEKLIQVADGGLGPYVHNLGFVPAHWFINGGGQFPYGDCTFKLALQNVVAYDYLVSQINLGCMASATPRVVIKGSPVCQKDDEGRDIPWDPTHYVQFEAERKDDTVTMGGGDAKLLEPTGQGMQVGIDKVGRQIKKDAAEQLCLSRKDPDKMTTAMSGKAIENIEEEFNDLIMDFRTCYLLNGYLPFVRKIARAAKLANHPLFAALTLDLLKGLGIDFPQLHEMSPQEFQVFMQALCDGAEAGILDGADAHDLLEAQLDTQRDTKRDEVKGRVEQFRQDNLKSKNQTKMPNASKGGT